MKSKKLKLQASSISRVLKCPGSMTLESRLPDRLRYFAFKDAAEFGTLCHAYGENRLVPLAEKERTELVYKVHDHPRKDEIIYTGTEYAKAVKKAVIKGGELHVEEKFRAEILGIDCVAKSDAFYVAPGRIRKFDLKSGRYDYTESATKQMEFAAQLYAYAYSMDGATFDTVTIQPNYYNESQRVVVSPKMQASRMGLYDFVKDLRSRQKEFNPGGHCKMCSAILTCKTVKNLIEEFFEMAKKATKEDLEFKKIYEKRDAVIAFLDALDAHIKQELESGKAIPGLCLEEYSGRRRWIDTGIVIEKLAYLKDKIYEPRQLKTPAQLEKLAGKANIEGLYDTPKLRRVAIRENIFEGFAE